MVLAVGLAILLVAGLVWVWAPGEPFARHYPPPGAVAGGKQLPRPIPVPADAPQGNVAATVSEPQVVATLVAHDSADRGKGLANDDRAEEGISGREPVVAEAPAIERWAIVPGCRPDGTRQTRFYFDVDDRLTARADTAPAAVTVEYLDKGSGSLALEYEAAPRTQGSAEEVAAHIQEAPEPVRLSGSGEWRTHRFELADARFRNGCEGRDLRIRSEEGAEVAIASIAVEIGDSRASQGLPAEVGPVPAVAADGGLWPGDIG